MNNSPQKYKYYRRFIDNEGDVKVPGFNPITGRFESSKMNHQRSQDSSLIDDNPFKRRATLKLKNLALNQ